MRTIPYGVATYCEGVFRWPKPKIWTIFCLYKAMGSVVNTPPVSMIMLSVGFCPFCTPYRAGVEYDCFFFALRLSRTFGGSYENGSTPLCLFITQRKGLGVSLDALFMNNSLDCYLSPHCDLLALEESKIICASSDPDSGGIELIGYYDWDEE